MEKIEDYIKKEMKDCPLTKEQEERFLVGFCKFLDDLEEKQCNMHVVGVRSEQLINIHSYVGAVNGNCRECGLPEVCHEL